MLKIFRNMSKFGSRYQQLFSFCVSYRAEAALILQEGISSMNQIKDEKKLAITNQYITKLWEGRLGLVENKILFYQFMDLSLNILRKEFALDTIDKNENKRIERSQIFFSIFKTMSELQFQRWDGLQDLLLWIKRDSTYELFIKTNKIHFYLEFINLLNINQIDVSEFHEKIDQAIFEFKKNTPILIEDRLSYYKVISIFRQFDKLEKAHLKMTIFDLSKLENRQIAYSLEQMDMINQYIDLICEIYFCNLLQQKNIIIEDEEDEIIEQDDITMLEPLQRLTRLFLQQDSFYYKQSISKYRDKLIQKQGYIDLVDPLKWKQMSTIAKALWILVEENNYDRSSIDLFENAIFRKLETDTASIQEGIQILKYIEDIPEIKIGHQFQILKSICDQINNQEFEELSINNLNLPILLISLFKLEKKAEDFELIFIQPSLAKLEQWLKKGKFDSQMKKVDWYDLQVVIQKYEYAELYELVNQKLQEQ